MVAKEKTTIIDYVGQRVRQTLQVNKDLPPHMDVMLEQLRRSEASTSAALPKRSKASESASPNSDMPDNKPHR